jgi:DNA-binding FadR family transcriptional regulator
VVLSNQVLAKYGISREIKRKAIANLASAGLIAIADRGRGRSPQITLMPSARAGRLPR